MKRFPILFLSVISISAILINCTSQAVISKSPDYNTRKLILRDEGLSQLSYIDLANPAANWFVPVPAGRDLQPVGNGRVLIGTGNGYEEREITTGKKVFELTTFLGTIAARRLRNGNTLLTGFNWQNKKGIVLVELDKNNNISREINFPEYNYVRLVRETVVGNFLITSDNTVFEGTPDGRIIWKATVAGIAKPHAWQAFRLGDGRTVLSTGYAKNLQIFSADGKITDSISGPKEVNPDFFAGFQILPNGNYVVANWQGHGPNMGTKGVQVLEYSPQGILVWSWKQDAANFSSIQGLIVLDNMDISKLHVEDKNGALSPVN